MQVGEVRMVGTGDRMMAIRRTERDYVYDLRDAYNEARSSQALLMGLEWYVHNGALRLGFELGERGNAA